MGGECGLDGIKWRLTWAGLGAFNERTAELVGCLLKIKLRKMLRRIFKHDQELHGGGDTPRGVLEHKSTCLSCVQVGKLKKPT